MSKTKRSLKDIINKPDEVNNLSTKTINQVSINNVPLELTEKLPIKEKILIKSPNKEKISENTIPKKLSFADILAKAKTSNIKEKETVIFNQESLKQNEKDNDKIDNREKENDKTDNRDNDKIDNEEYSEEYSEDYIDEDDYYDDYDDDYEHFCKDKKNSCGHCYICNVNSCGYCCEFCHVNEYCKHCLCVSLKCGCCPCDIVDKNEDEKPCSCCKFHDLLNCDWHCKCKMAECGCCINCDIDDCGCCVNHHTFQDCGHCIKHFKRDKTCTECFIVVK